MRWSRRGPTALALSVAVCLLGTSYVAAQSPPAPPERTVSSTFDAAMRDWLTKHKLQRASVAVMRNGKLVFAAGYGGRDANERVPVWSLSKAITAACIATLVQDGKLKF
jgi:CubicO group peptidase (beta-lactamase class C family)